MTAGPIPQELRGPAERYPATLEPHMEILLIVLLVILISGGGFYGHRRWRGGRRL